ncbi:MAG TPA: hypothetical protein VGE41_06345, partial [Verrucomicrobiae bacterium]
ENIFQFANVSTLLRGEPEQIRSELARSTPARAALYVIVIVLGAGLYGASVGCWRSPLQGAYTALKLPLILLATTLGNALLNAMLAPLLGLNLRFRETLLAILMSFTIAAVILGSFSPLVWFITWNLPALDPKTQISFHVHGFHLTTQVLLIALAGIAANMRLIQLLTHLSGSKQTARRVLLAWLAGNLLLGSQLSWLLRPFVGSPGLPVEFLRREALHGNFFESLLNAAKSLFS